MIEEINLDMTVPEAELCMAYMQPFIELTNTEPYKWQQGKKGQQLARISRFMNIAKQFGSNGKSHFTIIPEYSIPGIEGIDIVNQFLTDASWPSETIVIGGVDGLNKDEYATICNNPVSSVSVDNAPDQIADGKWINCCITWGKDKNGNLKRWIQPKLYPAWPENNTPSSQMFYGRTVNIFTIKFTNNTEYRFLSLMCFDWIGPINGTGNGILEILNQINQLWQRSGISQPIDIHFVLVLQHNDKPNERRFLVNANNFFVDRSSYQLINRDRSILFFVNTAGKHKPGKTTEYGYSSLIASSSTPYNNRDCCPLSFSSYTKKLRNSDNLGRCKEALFRENGACFHLFRFRHPRWIPGDGRCLFLDEARVYSIDDGIDDPRVPDGPVAASIKWVNDEIDAIEPVTLHENRNPIKHEVIASHENVSKEIRKVSGECLCKYIQYSFYNYKNFNPKITPVIHFVDTWSDEESDGLQTVIYALSIIGTCKSINVSDAVAHAVMVIGSNIIDIIVVHGGNTHEECFEYAKGFLNSQSRYGIVITKDIHNSPTDAKINRSILNTQESITEKGPSITNPDARFIYRGYQNIQTCCFSATSVDNLRDQIDRLLGV